MTDKYHHVLRIAALIAVATTALHAQPSLKAAASSMAKASPIPRACSQAEFSAYGKPTFAPKHKGPLIGFSLAKHQFRAGEPVVIQIWINNSHGGPTNIWSCEAVDFPSSHESNSDIGLEHFKWMGFDLYNDATGRRILSRQQQKALASVSTPEQLCSTDKGRFKLQGMLMQCLKNVPMPIPARACFTKSDSDFTFDLLSRYDLPPGQYTIRFRSRKSGPYDICHPMNEPPWHGPKNPSLTFSVVHP